MNTKKRVILHTIFETIIYMKNKVTLSGLQIDAFNKQIDSKMTMLCTLTNKKGAELTITNYGAKIVSLMVPDRSGKLTDVVTGHNSIEEYLVSEEPYFGAICGRYGNRIAKGKFVLDGTVYDKLAINNGPNSLHGGLKGFNAVVWDLKQIDEQTVELKYTSADGEEGFPGQLETTVTYHFSDDNEVVIMYNAVTDKPTVLNLTNHSYFNLSGAGDPSIGDHLLTINADYYLPTDETAIPYGPKEKVEGTPMDFRTPYEVGARIDEDFEALNFGKGYDHTYILNKKEENELSFCARCVSPKTGIVMDVYTTQPGVQLYTGNWMTGNFEGKNGQRYPARAALCLETQHYPDSPNKPEYPTTVLRPGEVFQSKTIYKFATE
ncbi:MAG: Aldose 1-epimerase [Parabacteroides sp.]